MPGRSLDRKRAVLSFLKSAAAGEGRLPSARELETAIKSDKLNSKNFEQTWRVQREKRSFSDLSIAGMITAGFGDSAEPAEMGSIPIDLDALDIKTTSRTFALRVRGDSMTGAHIADGDLVVLEAREPKIGEIVAALIDGETTLKRFVTQDGALFLRAENPRYPDLIPLHELTIQGVVRAVIRLCDRPRPLL